MVDLNTTFGRGDFSLLWILKGTTYSHFLPNVVVWLRKFNLSVSFPVVHRIGHSAIFPVGMSFFLRLYLWSSRWPGGKFQDILMNIMDLFSDSSIWHHKYNEDFEEPLATTKENLPLCSEIRSPVHLNDYSMWSWNILQNHTYQNGRTSTNACGHILKEHHKFRAKTEISIISDFLITM